MPEDIPLSPKAEQLRGRLEKDPNSKLFLQLAEEYRKLGAREAALEVCRKGLEKHPTYHTARAALGRIYLDMGRAEEAVRELRKVLQAIPGNILAGKLLADSYARLGALPQALKTLERTLAHDPGDEELLTRIEAMKKRMASEAGGQAPAPPAAAPTAPAGHPAAPAQEAPPPIDEAEPPALDAAPSAPPAVEAETTEAPAPLSPLTPDEGTAIMDEPPALELEPRRTGGAAPPPQTAPPAGPPEPFAPTPVHAPDAISQEVTHGLDEELVQPAQEAVEETLQVTPSPDLLPTDLAEESGTQAAVPDPQAAPPAAPPAAGGGASRELAERYYGEGQADKAIETLERLLLMDQAGPEDEVRLKELLAEKGKARFPHARSGEIGPKPLTPEQRRDQKRLSTYRRWLDALES